MHRFELCGAPILGAATGWVVGRVDTASPCLSLPTDLFGGGRGKLGRPVCESFPLGPVTHHR